MQRVLDKKTEELLAVFWARFGIIFYLFHELLVSQNILFHFRFPETDPDRLLNPIIIRQCQLFRVRTTLITVMTLMTITLIPKFSGRVEEK
jgi:hypothetical protein